jgi:glycosyltransferase involved in cell wall biosynthesis
MGLGDRVIAVSEAVAKSMEKRGVQRSKLRVVLNGTIGSPRLSSESPPAQILNRPAITFVGGLHPRKGVDDLINAFKTVSATVPTAFLYLVGSGPYREAYQELGSQSVGDRIEFADAKPTPTCSDPISLSFLPIPNRRPWSWQKRERQAAPLSPLP